jgi:hypothetical protein
MESEAWISNNRNLLGALTPVPGEDSLVVVTGQWGRRDEEEEAEPRPLVPPIPRRRPRGWLRLTVGAVELARLRVWRLAPLADFLSFPASWLRAGARGARCVRSPAACTGSFACGLAEFLHVHGFSPGLVSVSLACKPILYADFHPLSLHRIRTPDHILFDPFLEGTYII